jgi:stearoyl-CoA desaturase (delta-9 desaturase)
MGYDLVAAATTAVVMFWIMAWAFERRLIYATTVYMHRAMAHDALKLRYPLMLWAEYSLNRVGVWCRAWVITHRKHHQKTDQPEDPHSPWNFVNSAIKDLDARRRAGVQYIVDHNLELYRAMAGNLELVNHYTGPMRATFIDGLGVKLSGWRTLKLTFLVLHFTHMMPYLLVGWVLGLNMWFYVPMAFVAAIFSEVVGGHRYIRKSAKVNAYGHAWPVRSPIVSVGNAANHRGIARKTGGEGFQYDHHKHQRSARLRQLIGTKPLDDKGWLIIKVLQFLRLAYDVRVENDNDPERRMLADDLTPLPDPLPAAA